MKISIAWNRLLKVFAFQRIIDFEIYNIKLIKCSEHYNQDKRIIYSMISLFKTLTFTIQFI